MVVNVKTSNMPDHDYVGEPLQGGALDPSQLVQVKLEGGDWRRQLFILYNLYFLHWTFIAIIWMIFEVFELLFSSF